MECYSSLCEALKPYPWLIFTINIVALVVVAYLANWIVKRILLRWVNRLMVTLTTENDHEQGMRWIDRLRTVKIAGQDHEQEVQNAIIGRLTNVVPAIIIAAGATILIPADQPALKTGVNNLCSAFIVLTVSLALAKILDLIEIFYNHKHTNVSASIKIYMQIIKIFIYAVAIVLIISMLINRSPLYLLSGLGAMTAVLMLVFQDTILSAVASIQINSNDIVRMGDWIEMPSVDADGEVVEMSLHTIKVQNWDMTITTIPTRKLISESFKNWRNMISSGGRRISRSIRLDQRCVRFLTDSEIQKIENITKTDIRSSCTKESQGYACPLTNAGLFRAYMEKYLQAQARIRHDLPLVARQLQPEGDGLPIEFYCFTSETGLDGYEKAQADIYDHLIATLPLFDLRVFQLRSDGPDLPLNNN